MNENLPRVTSYEAQWYIAQFNGKSLLRQTHTRKYQRAHARTYARKH